MRYFRIGTWVLMVGTVITIAISIYNTLRPFTPDDIPAVPWHYYVFLGLALIIVLSIILAVDVLSSELIKKILWSGAKERTESGHSNPVTLYNGRRKKFIGLFIFLLVLQVLAPAPAAALTNFTSYWSPFSGGQLVLYWQGAQFITGGDVDPAVTVEYMRAKDKTWVPFDRYAFNVSNRSVEIDKDDPRLVPGAIYYFRAGQRGLDDPLMMSSSGPVTIPGAPVDPDDLAHVNDPVDNHPFGGDQQESNDSEVIINKPENNEPMRLFTNSNWPKIMFWYYILASLSGVFILYSIIKCGYQYIFCTFNPGVRASLTETLQRCFIAVAIIMLAPVFIKVVVSINDAFVYLFATAGNSIISPPQQLANNTLNGTGLFEQVISAPFKTLINIVNYVLGTKDLSVLIFNGELDAFKGGYFKGFAVNTGNIFGDIVIQCAFAGFTFYFNALYLTRHWVIVATFTATPLLIWIWVVSHEKQVIEIWAGELISTIFMQTFHALTFSIFFSIASSRPVSGLTDTAWLADGLRDLGIWVAGFGGVAAVAALIYLGFQMVINNTERGRAEIKEGLKKAFLGLIIIGLSLTIASFLTYLLGGDWGVNDLQFDTAAESGLGPIEIFFMLLVIIPTSKMMHSIFMKLIQRIGTVDEERWAGIGLKGLGGLAGMVGLGRVAAGAIAGRGLSMGSFTNRGGFTTVGTTGGTNDGTTGRTTGRAYSGMTESTMGGTNSETGTTGTRGTALPVNKEPLPIENAIERGLVSSNSKWFDRGAVMGGASGLVAPAAMPALAGFGGWLASKASAPFTTGFQIGKEVLSRTGWNQQIRQGHNPYKALKLSGGFEKLRMDLLPAARQVTGMKTNAGALTSIASALTLSPLGRTMARTGSRLGRLEDIGKFSYIDEAIK